MTARLTRAALGAAVAALATCSVAGTAHAATDPAPEPLSQADLAAAAAAAAAPHGRTLAKQLASATGNDKLATADRTLKMSSTPLQINVLSPEFVGSGRGPVANPAYVASTATVGGDKVTLWSMKTDSGWTAFNAAEGGTEAELAAKAAGAPMFREPQINAWYALKGGKVVALNRSAEQSVGAGMAVGDYQKMVHTRYGDKLPGSAYARSSKGGGYTPATGRPAEATKPLAGSPAGGALAAGAVALVAGAGLLTRRRLAAR